MLEAAPARRRRRAERSELDLTEAVFDLARRADQHPEVYRWSYRRDFGDSRLVVVDSRAARVLEPEHRSMLDPDEMALARRAAERRRRAPADRHVAAVPAAARPARPRGHRRGARHGHARTPRRPTAAEKARQSIDLEHWAAFNDGFVEVFEMVMEVARGERGRAPSSVVFLSGDVHNSYVAEVVDADDAARGDARASSRRSARRSATRCRGWSGS